MEKLNIHIETIINKVLSKDASPLEQKEFDTWVNTDPKNKEIFDSIKSTWNLVGEISLNKDKTDHNWQRINEKIKNAYKVPEYITLEEPQIRHFQIGWREIRNMAAILVVMVAIGVLIKMYISRTKTIELVASVQNIKKANLLPDGSEVYLNIGSKIEYTNKFNDKNREMVLHGEGYFKVSPNKEKPFIIHCLNSTTQVIGTSFNINTDSVNNEIIISVLTGKVEFFETNAPNNKIMLEKEEEGRIDLKTNKISKSPVKDRNFLAWQTGVLTFEGTPLIEVLNSFGKYYKKKIIIQRNNINDIKITSKYDNQTVEQVLKELSILTGIQCENINNKIIIK